jgi:hypothetical protein
MEFHEQNKKPEGAREHFRGIRRDPGKRPTPVKPEIPHPQQNRRNTVGMACIRELVK